MNGLNADIEEAALDDEEADDVGSLLLDCRSKIMTKSTRRQADYTLQSTRRVSVIIGLPYTSG